MVMWISDFVFLNMFAEHLFQSLYSGYLLNAQLFLQLLNSSFHSAYLFQSDTSAFFPVFVTRMYLLRLLW